MLAQLDGVRKLKLVILDACRNNPFAPAGAKRSVSRGLAPMEPEDNTLIAYAAKDGTTADDGVGRRHSLFTEALLKHIATPGLEVNLLFRRVRDDVIKATSHDAQPQQPHVYASLGGQELYLLPSAAAAPSLAPAAPAPSRAEVVQLCESIAKNPSLSVVQSLLGVYRGTPMASCIEARIEELSRQAALTATPPGVGPAASPPVEKPVPAPKEPEKGAAPVSRAEGLKCCIDAYFETQGTQVRSRRHKLSYALFQVNDSGGLQRFANRRRRQYAIQPGGALPREGPGKDGTSGATNRSKAMRHGGTPWTTRRSPP